MKLELDQYKYRNVVSAVLKLKEYMLSCQFNVNVKPDFDSFIV